MAKPNAKPPQRGNDVARMLSSGLQLAATVGGFTLLGYALDQHYGTQKPWFAIGGGLVGIIFGFAQFLKQFMK